MGLLGGMQWDGIGNFYHSELVSLDCFFFFLGLKKN